MYRPIVAWIVQDLKQVTALFQSPSPLARMMTWIMAQGLKRAVIAAVSFVMVFLILSSVLQRLWLETTRNRLMENPEPLPSYIFSIFPSGRIETRYYTEQRGGICATIDARILNPFATSVDRQVFQDDSPFDRIDLYVDGELINGMSEDFFTAPEWGNTAIHFCGEVHMSPGVRLAQITIRSAISGTLNYQWAFQVVETP